MKWSGQDAGKGAMSGAATGSAFGPWGAVIGGAVGGIGGGLLGGESRAEQERKQKLADQARQQAIDALSGVKAPEYDKVNFGTMDKNYNVNSEFQGLNIDPELRAKQINALSALEGVHKAGGLTAQDRANWDAYQMQANTADKGRRDAIMQQAQMRGMASGGNSLLAQLQSAQDTTNQQSQMGQNLAGLAQQRALDAMMQSGQLAGGIRSQDFAEKARRAEALDAMSKFNTSNLMDQDRFNIGQNDKTAMYVNEIKKMSFDDQMRVAENIARAMGMEMDFQQAMATMNAQQRAQMFDSLFKMGAAGSQGYFNYKKDQREQGAYDREYGEG